MGCPSANNKLSAAAVFEWMKENCGQFRSQTGLPELPAIAIDPQDLELAEAWNALRTIVEYHQTRWTDAARKAQLVGIIDAFGELFPSAGTDADKLLLRLVFRELSLIPADINRNG